MPKSTRWLPAPALSTENGGPFALDPAAKDKDTNFEDIFEVDISVPKELAVERWGQRAWVRFDHRRQPGGLGDFIARRDNYSSGDFMSERSLSLNIVAPRACARRRVRTEYPAVDSPATWIAAHLSVAASGWRSRRAMRIGLAAATACATDDGFVGCGALAPPRRRKKLPCARRA